MVRFDCPDCPHRRFNPLTREWVLVSPHRTKRPWLGQLEKPIPDRRPTYDSTCYLCPGNERAEGVVNPQYEATFVFDNDFAALMPHIPEAHMNEEDLLIARSEPGLCRVVCFSPNHSLTLPQMSVADIERVVDVWDAQYRELGARPEINYVQIFENKGKMMGASNPHPHGQIWSSASLPHLPALEQSAQVSYLGEKGSCLLCDYVRLELAHEERVVCQNADFCALVPFWALWPFETMILSRRHVTSLPELTADERTSLADIIRRMTIRFDNLFEISFPYSMGIHQMPTDGRAHDEWHLHLHFYPPLLRSATIRKFMVGYEMLANPQRDLTAEAAAERLRSQPEIRFDTIGPDRSD
jgi:UDPglucose--hexose-1-phosphate uridylyltransferase